MELEALKNEILSYTPGKAVPYDDERVIFPDKLVIGMVNDYLVDKCMPAHCMRYFLYGGEEEANKRQCAGAGERQTSTEIENQQEFWITDCISLIITSRPDDGVTSKVEASELAGKVGYMVKIVDTFHIETCVTESKKIKEITGRFPVCAIMYSKWYVGKAIDDLVESGMTDHEVIPWPSQTRSDNDKLPWLHLLHKCLPEGDRVLAGNDLKKICKNPRCELLYEKTKKDLEEANQEKKSLQHKIKELEQKLQESLASPEGNDKALDEALENWKQRTKRQLENKIRSAEQQKAGTPQQM